MKAFSNLFILVWMCIYACTPTFAQQQSNGIEAPKLEGMWQVCNVSRDYMGGQLRTTTGPYIKLLSSDGTFVNLLVNTSGGTSFIAALGTYRQTSDSTYVETITKSYNAPIYTGLDNTIHFKFLTDNIVQFQFRVPLQDNLWTEYWVKITQPDMAQSAAKQSTTNLPLVEEKIEGDMVYAKVDKMPEFPGGMAALMAFIGKNLKYSDEYRGFHGRVIVQFVVEKDGSITHTRIVRSLDPALDKEALRVVQLMPQWKPGYQNGEAVRVSYTIPVLFRLQ